MSKPESSDQLSSEAKCWTERWTRLARLQGRNQRLSLKAENANGNIAFLKVLDATAPSEQRQRMRREALALRASDVPRVPRLIETNTHHVDDEDFELYIATEFIEGRQLDVAVSSDSIAPKAAVSITAAICETVREAHRLGIYHRDIKPDNIVLVASSTEETPYLVDFGMAFLEEDDGDFATHRNTEVGNRFIRLPEYSSGFDTKSDSRSDVTQCVGLLFYMLTKIKPSTLQDADGHLPHQRRNAQIMLQGSGLNFDRVMALFDKGFQVAISKRFQTIEELLAPLPGLLECEAIDASNNDALRDRLRERFGSETRRSQLTTAELVRSLLEFADRQVRLVAQVFGNALVVSQTNYASDTSHASTELTISDAMDKRQAFTVKLRVEAVGPDLLLALVENESNHRMIRISSNVEPGEDAIAFIQNFVLTGVLEATSEERFTIPRNIEPSTTVLKFADAAVGSGHREEIRPRIEIAWYRPRFVGDQARLSWRFTNVGPGDARGVRVFLPGLSCYELGSLPASESVLREMRYDDRSAYHDFSKPPIHAIVEFTDVEGDLYRQMANVVAFPAYGTADADFKTEQLGEPAAVTRWIVEPDPEGVDRFLRSSPVRWPDVE